jgi:hypothetical protein
MTTWNCIAIARVVLYGYIYLAINVIVCTASTTVVVLQIATDASVCEDPPESMTLVRAKLPHDCMWLDDRNSHVPSLGLNRSDWNTIFARSVFAHDELDGVNPSENIVVDRSNAGPPDASGPPCWIGIAMSAITSEPRVLMANSSSACVSALTSANTNAFETSPLMLRWQWRSLSLSLPTPPAVPQNSARIRVNHSRTMYNLRLFGLSRPGAVRYLTVADPERTANAIRPSRQSTSRRLHGNDEDNAEVEAQEQAATLRSLLTKAEVAEIKAQTSMREHHTRIHEVNITTHGMSKDIANKTRSLSASKKMKHQDDTIVFNQVPTPFDPIVIGDPPWHMWGADAAQETTSRAQQAMSTERVTALATSIRLLCIACSSVDINTRATKIEAAIEVAEALGQSPRRAAAEVAWMQGLDIQEPSIKTWIHKAALTPTPERTIESLHLLVDRTALWYHATATGTELPITIPLDLHDVTFTKDNTTEPNSDSTHERHRETAESIAPLLVLTTELVQSIECMIVAYLLGAVTQLQWDARQSNADEIESVSVVDRTFHLVAEGWTGFTSLQTDPAVEAALLPMHVAMMRRMKLGLSLERWKRLCS